MIAYVALGAGCLVIALGILMLLSQRRKLAGADLQPAQSNRSILRDQLAELDAEHSAGTITDDEYATMKIDIERRALTELAVHQADGAPTRMRNTSRWIVVAAIVLFVPLSASLLYWKLGRPDLLTAPPVPLPAADPHGDLADLDAMAQRLRARLDASGQNDGDGWVLLARTYVELKRYPQAVAAFERAHQLLGDDAQVLADYADAHTMENARQFDKKSLDLIARALKADPANPKAIELDASVAYDSGNYTKAMAQWEKLLALVEPGSDHARVIAANISEASARAGTPAPLAISTASKAPVAAANAGVQGTVVISPALQARLSPSDTLFVFARVRGVSKAPVAIIRATAKELPFAFNLDDSRTMVAGSKLSALNEVEIVARISRSGSAAPQAGDLEGTAPVVKIGTAGVRIEIVREIR
jgi:cytochrome c-type biogenesis protein CcmH